MTSYEINVILQFLAEAQERIEKHPDKMTFKPEAGNLVINWLRARLPSTC